MTASLKDEGQIFDFEIIRFSILIGRFLFSR